jgi:hypothetical protein
MKVQGHQRRDTTHEPRDADVLNVGMVALLVFLAIGICLLVCWMMLRYFNGGRQTNEPPRVLLSERAARFPQPQLISEPGSERWQVHLNEQAKLQSYGWVDRKAGIARIPVTRAMQILLQRGLPQVGAGQTRLQLLQSRPTSITQPRNPIALPSPEPSP